MSDLPFLPYGRQNIDDADVAAVVEVLKSSYLTTGPAVGEFETALAAAVGSRFAVAVSNGTAALHAACAAAGLGPGDEALVPAITFVASANCLAYLGARPRFVDVDPESGLLDVQQLASALTPECKAIIPVHMTGRPVDLTAIRAFATEHGLTVIEDAAHALGASYDGHAIGSCQLSDMAIFSFHPVKHVTTGEGGAVTTNDPELHQRLLQFRNHGLVHASERLERPSPGPWYHEMQALGHNLRLSDIQCALGTSQLAKLPRFISERRTLAKFYDEQFAGQARVTPLGPGASSGVGTSAESAYHLYVVLVDFEAAGKTRAEVMAELRDLRIGTQVHYIPVPSQPYYERLGYKMDSLPGSQRYYDRALSLPLYPGMSAEDARRVVDGVAAVVGR